MDCLKKSKSGAQILLDYASGALDPGRHVELERHAEICAECKAMIDAQRELWETLDHWTAPAVSTGFNARLYERIAEEQKAPLWRRWMLRLTQPAVPYAFWKPALAAVACGVLAVGYLVDTPGAVHRPAPAKTVQVETQHVDIEQVANALEELDLLMPSTPSGASTSTANPM